VLRAYSGAAGKNWRGKMNISEHRLTVGFQAFIAATASQTFTLTRTKSAPATGGEVAVIAADRMIERFPIMTIEAICLLPPFLKL